MNGVESGSAENGGSWNEDQKISSLDVSIRDYLIGTRSHSRRTPVGKIRDSLKYGILRSTRMHEVLVH